MTVVTWRGAKFAAPVFRGFLEIHFSRYSSLTCKTVSALTGQKQWLVKIFGLQLHYRLYTVGSVVTLMLFVLVILLPHSQR